MDKKKRDIFGLILGTALENKKMIRQSMNSLVKTGKINKFFDGLLSILLLDTESEESIQRFCDELELDGTLVISLIELLSSDSKRFA